MKNKKERTEIKIHVILYPFSYIVNINGELISLLAVLIKLTVTETVFSQLP